MEHKLTDLKEIEKKLKGELVEHLKKKHITDVVSLWSHAKDWAWHKGYEMGGSYASWSTDITVKIVIDKGMITRFNIDLKEVK